MTVYTVQIETAADVDAWQALPAETIDGATAREVAGRAFRHQRVQGDVDWRITVWDGADADTGAEPVYTLRPTGARVGDEIDYWLDEHLPISRGKVLNVLPHGRLVRNLRTGKTELVSTEPFGEF